jgi:hypothetical protein
MADFTVIDDLAAIPVISDKNVIHVLDVMVFMDVIAEK